MSTIMWRVFFEVYHQLIPLIIDVKPTDGYDFQNVPDQTPAQMERGCTGQQLNKSVVSYSIGFFVL